MAFKITKEETNRLGEIAGRLANARMRFDEAVETANANYEDEIAGINEKAAAYNEILEEARGYVEDIHSERYNEFDDKSETWQEGERGEATREWLEALENIKDNELEDIETLEFEPLDYSEMGNHAELLTGIEIAPNY